MKSSSLKRKIKNTGSSCDKKILDTVPVNPNLSTKVDIPDMTEQVVTPPARVWDRIEKILDQQDERRKHANQIIAASFGKVDIYKRKSVYLAAAAGVSVLAGIFWIVR